MSRDERDTIFARMAWPTNSEAYKDYYSKNPSLKDEDDDFSGEERGRFYFVGIRKTF